MKIKVQYSTSVGVPFFHFFEVRRGIDSLPSVASLKLRLMLKPPADGRVVHRKAASCRTTRPRFLFENRDLSMIVKNLEDSV